MSRPGSRRWCFALAALAAGLPAGCRPARPEPAALTPVTAPGGRLTLPLPSRPAGAPGGAAIAREVDTADLGAREERLFREIAAGNVPGWLRGLVRVEMTRRHEGRDRVIAFWATPDYLAVGSDTDYLLTPLSPQTAQRLADRLGASLPTPLMVDAIWAAAAVRLDPAPIPPSPRMTSVAVFADHTAIVGQQRREANGLPGTLVAGDKKDVVLVPALAEQPGKVAIYGWHRRDGSAIQPVYLGHTNRWVDYSHGIRLVSRRIELDGVEHDLREVLRDSALAPLFTGGGTIPDPCYPIVVGDSGAVSPPRMSC